MSSLARFSPGDAGADPWATGALGCTAPLLLLGTNWAESIRLWRLRLEGGGVAGV